MTDTLSLLTELPFSLPGRIFRSPMPFGRYDAAGQVVELYRQNGVQAVLALPEAAEILEKTGRDLLQEYADQGLAVYHCPIRDFSVPSLAELESAVAAALAEARAGHNVAIHCNAGIGRTGLVLACLARRVFGWEAEQAIDWVRRYIPGAVETGEQRQLVEKFVRQESA